MKKQKGFTLVQIMGGLIISGLVLNTWNEHRQREQERGEFEALGNMISEHSRAVAEWVVDAGGAAIPQTYTNTDWLKSNTACGITTGGSEAYLPCGFNFQSTRYGAAPTTVVSNVGGVTTAVSTWSSITVGGIPKSVGVGYAVAQAEKDSRDTLRGVVTYTEDNNAVITASVDVNNGTGVYVKRSGDTMSGDLDMGSNNVSSVGTLDATTGAFTTVNTTDVNATDVNAVNVNATDVNATDLSASADITAGGDVSGTDINASRYVYSRRLYDTDNSSYYVDPSNTSKMNVAELNRARLMSNYSVGNNCTTKTIGTTSTGVLLSCVSGKWVLAAGKDGEDGGGVATHCPATTLKYYTFNSAFSHSLNGNFSVPKTNLGVKRSKSVTYGSACDCCGSYYLMTTTYTCLATGSFGARAKSVTSHTSFCDPG